MLPMGVLFASVFAATQPLLSAEPCDFHEIYQRENVSCEFAVFNSGDQAQVAHIDFPGDPAFKSVNPMDFEVPAKGRVAVHAVMDLRHDHGVVQHVIPLLIGPKGKQEPIGILARGYVESVLDDPSPKLNFDVVKASAPENSSKIFVLQSSEFPDLKLVDLAPTSPKYVRASISADGKSATISFRGDIPWGYKNDFLYLRTNSTKQSEIAINFEADVQGDVVPASNPFALGLMRRGNRNEFLIRLTDSSSRDFSTGQIKFDRFKATGNMLPCSPAVTGCKLLNVKIDNDQPTGEIAGTISVDLPGYKRQLSISVWGLLVKADAKIKSLNEEMEKNSAGAKSAVQSNPPIDLSKILKQSVRGQSEAPSVPPPGTGPLLKWSVGDEGTAYGYAVYRGEAETGPFMRVNEDIIPAQGAKGDRTSVYQWRDTSAVAGKTYWYYVTTLLFDGRKQRLSEPQRTVAK